MEETSNYQAVVLFCYVQFTDNYISSKSKKFPLHLPSILKNVMQMLLLENVNAMQMQTSLQMQNTHTHTHTHTHVFTKHLKKSCRHATTASLGLAVSSGLTKKHTVHMHHLLQCTLFPIFNSDHHVTLCLHLFLYESQQMFLVHTGCCMYVSIHLRIKTMYKNTSIV